MAKLKFKDEDGEFIPVVQDVLVNNNSVFDGKDANIELKTINSQAITGSGNIEISPSSKVDILLSTTPDQEGFYYSKYSPSELWDMYNEEETFLTINGQLIANATYENGEFSCALLFAKEVWTPIYVTMYVVRPNDDNKLRKMTDMPAASADFTINGHKLSDNMGAMTLTPEDLAYVNTIKGTSVTNAKGALDTLTTNVNALSTVEANPTLAGTESDLTALEVDGTKYKIPSGGGGGGNTTTIQSSWSTMPQNPNVGDRVTNVNDNSGTPGGGGGGNSTLVQTSWDNMPANPSVGDRVTNLNDISGFKFLQPEIDVTTPIGTEITVTDGTTSYTKTATETVTKFNVNDYGTWTVSAALDQTTKTKNVYVDAVKLYGVGFGFVPIEYQEVEYIQSNPTGQFSGPRIDTGLIASSNTKLEMDFDIYQLSNIQTFYNSYSGSGSRYTLLEVSGKFRFDYASSMLNTGLDITLGRHTIVVDKGITIDSNTYGQSQTSFTCSGNLYLLGSAHDSGYTSYTKLYSAKVYESGTLMRNFVPCYRKADNEVGLYDLENDAFYTNSGAGTLTKGGNV